tara:strand:+ start:1568 stop:2011 length:444 start_codon:yes stop_codon:yes gene_type:complete
MSDLRLSAEDVADLEIISTCLQDAVTQVRDLVYLPQARRFAMVVNRFRWENEPKAGVVHERTRAGLHFDSVSAARARHIAQDRSDGILNLLSVRFEELNAPSGIVTLTFSGGGEIRLEVEALDVHLSDLGLVWETPNLPHHDLETDK